MQILYPFTILLVVALCSTEARGEVYHFIDADGVRHFTNVPTDSRYQRLMIQEIPALRRGRGDHPGRYAILRTIQEAADRHRVEPALVKAIVRTESNFDPLAVSSAGAMGLMQLMPGTAERWSVQNPFDPVENVWGGVRYFRYLLDLFDGDVLLALAAYHAGESRVEQAREVPAIPATQKYIRSVLKHYRSYQRLQAEGSMIYQQRLPNGTIAYRDRPDAALRSLPVLSSETSIR